FERKLELAFPLGRIDIGRFRRPGSSIPDHHGAAAVLTSGDYSLEIVVLDGVIFNLHRQPLDGRVVAWPFRHRPGKHYPFPFKAEVIVERGGAMFLDDERQSRLRSTGGTLFAFRLRGDIEAALLAVLVERH